MTDETTKNKAITVSAIMNNSKLFKVVSDALNAPPGSSKREKAASILRIFNKGNKSRILDGKGGMPDPNMATLYGPSGSKPTPVEIGSQRASDLQSQGWGLKPDSYVTPESVNPTPKNKVLFASYPEEKPWDKDAPNMKMFKDFETYSEVPDYSSLIDGITEPRGYDKWYQNLSEEDKDLFKPFYESAIAGLSPQTAAWKLMEDTDRLKKMGVPESLLPTHGASLTGQIKSLSDTLKEETGLTRTENNLRNLQERGMTITDDLTFYIKNKDKYIKNINKMMDGAKEYEDKIDMSLPENQRTMKNYNNYLHILKGRQQQRYIDFLNTGINYHNAELTRATNVYNTARQNFTEELSYQTSITKENYERLNNILMDMYSNITGREEREIEKKLLENELLQSNYETMEAQIDYVNLSLGIDEDEEEKIEKKKIIEIARQVIADNPDSSDEELKVGLLENTPELSVTLINSLIKTRPVKKIEEDWIKENFTEDEIKEAINRSEYASFWKSRGKEIAEFYKKLKESNVNLSMINEMKKSGLSNDDILDLIIEQT